MRRPLQRLGGRDPQDIATDPIDLREIRRAAPPRAELVQRRLEREVRPDPPEHSARFTMIGAPIPDADIADPVEESWSGEGLWAGLCHWWSQRWTRRRRRQVRAGMFMMAAVLAAALVLMAVVSALHDGPLSR